MAGQADIDTKEAQPVRVLPARNAGEWQNDLLAALAVSIILLTLFAIPAIRLRPLSETAEARVAVVAREMLKSGKYLIPTMGGEARLNKPPLPYWMTAFTAKVIGGEDPTSQRALTRATQLPSALLGALTIFIVVLCGSICMSRTAGVLAGLILGLSLLVTHFAQLGYGDTALMCFCAGTLCGAAYIVSGPQPGFLSAILTGICLGLAVLTKGHIPVLILIPPLLAEILIRRSFNARKVILMAVVFVVAALIAAPWFYMLEQQHQGSLATMLGEVKSGINPVGHRQNDALYYYFYRLAAGLLPWTATLLFAWPVFVFGKRGPQNPNRQDLIAREHMRFFLLTFVLGFIGFYAVPKQQDYYLLPLLPALALATGYVFSSFKESGNTAEERVAWYILGFGFLAGLALAVFPFVTPHLTGLVGADVAEDLTEIATTINFFSIPAGIAVIALHFYMARQWVEGRPLNAGIAMAIVAFAALMTWSIFAASKSKQSERLYAEAARLRNELTKIGPDAKVFGAGESESLLVFYLERPVKPLKDLANEEKLGGDGKRLVLVASRKVLKERNLGHYLPGGEDQFAVLEQIALIDWQRLANEEKSRKKKD